MQANFPDIDDYQFDWLEDFCDEVAELFPWLTLAFEDPDSVLDSPFN